MNNYDELEKLYYKKKFKKYFSYILIFLIFIIVGFFTYFNFKKNEQIHKLISVEKKSKKYMHKEINKTKNIESIKHKIESNKTKNYKSLKDGTKKSIDKLFLNPILPDISSDSISEENKTIKNTIKPTTTTDNLETKKELKEINTTNEIQEPIKPKIIIKVIKEKESLKNLIDNYQLSPDYSTAIKISTIYLEKKKYNQSIKWAKKANEINPEDSKSWLLYAKSLVKLGKRNRAKLLLENYLKVYGNNQEIINYLRSLNERKHTKKN